MGSRKARLTDPLLRSIAAKPPLKGSPPEDIYDTQEPGFGARVFDSGAISFVLIARFKPGSSPARRALGKYVVWEPAEKRAAEARYRALPEAERRDVSIDDFLLREYGATSLAAAREKARRWKNLVAQGIDPAIEEQRAKDASAAKQANTFAAVVEDFIRMKAAGERRGREVERDLRTVFLPVFGGRPITDVTDLEIQKLIEKIAEKAPVRARNLLALMKRFFAWAKARRVYGLRLSPCADLRPRDLFGDRPPPRDRELTDDELFAFMRAVGRMSYPHGPVYRLLLLTGLRLNEAADASWSELDPMVARALRAPRGGCRVDWSLALAERRRWVIPKERMKGRGSRARAHAVPLTQPVLELLEGLPVLPNGDFLFSTDAGATSVWMGDKIKKALDERMLRTLRALARRRGENVGKVRLEPWTNHDLRRVVRSGLSRLRVPDHVAESILAHTPAIIARTYNTDDLFEQKAEALAAWGRHLDSILKPRADNVVSLAAGQRSGQQVAHAS